MRGTTRRRWSAAYNRAVSRPPVTVNAHRLPFWARVAALLGFLAVLSALLAPVSMLARDVQTGQFGGICSTSMSLAGLSQGGDAQPMPHCDFCGGPALLAPSLPAARIPCFAGTQVAATPLPPDAGKAVEGLPFSRGPPHA